MQSNFRWIFFHDLFDQWQWAKVDAFGKTVGHCDGSFASEQQCKLDARLHGCCADPPLESNRPASVAAGTD